VNFQILSLQPQIFDSFFETSLIARGLAQEVYTKNIINWRDKYGVGNYKQVDDRPYGGSHGMVLQAEPVYNALQDNGALSELFQPAQKQEVHNRIHPNNSAFETLVNQRKDSGLPTRNATIMLTPRGFPYTQQTAEWLAESFDQITILCGRYEGFDARVNECVDMEISLGNYILNGGEVGAMVVVESVARLLPGFLTKEHTAEHDSFSSKRTIHRESMEYIVGKHRLDQSPRLKREFLQEPASAKLYSNHWWSQNILPYIEYPQYTRPEVWHNMQVPAVLLGGNHKDIDEWRKTWHKKEE
jgi:tRNA (guanine37-N1)-methyltransferase